MTMLRLQREQRELLADKLSDVANLALAALIFGQAFSGSPFSWALAAAGFGFWATAMIFAVKLRRERA